MTDPLDLPHIERIAVAATRAHYQIEPFPGVRKDMTEILLALRRVAPTLRGHGAG